jgi:phosphomannomutase
MQDIIFREYDIRGKVGTELIVDEMADLSCAIAYYFLAKNPETKKVALGMDGRTHSAAIKEQIVRGLTESGLTVEFIGVCTTPVMYFAMNTTDADAGLMITASHNPKEYNGLKIMLGKEGVSGSKIQEIKTLFHEKKRIVAPAQGDYNEKPLIPLYVAWLAQHFKHLKGWNIAAVVDCGNGAGGTVMPDLVDAMQWPRVTLLYAEVDGSYPHHEADPTIEKNMLDVKNILFSTDTALGIGLDGDCDRMAPMTKSGFLVPGDQLLALYAQEIVKKHPGANVVFDIKSSSALIEGAIQWLSSDSFHFQL